MKRFNVLVVLTAVAVALADTSCTREMRAQRAVSRADQYYTAGQYDRAEIEYKNALLQTPLHPHAIARLGMIYRIDGRTAPAVAYLAKAKELQPDDVDIRLNLGLAYFTGGAPQLARPEALFVIDHRPDDVEAPILLVEASGTAEDRKSAGQRLRAVAPKNRSTVLVALGQLALREGRPDDAQRLFEEALASDPKSTAAAGALGMLSWARKELTRADQQLKLAAEASPIRSPRRIQYAQFKLQTGDSAAAKRMLADVSRQAPDFIPAALLRVELAASEKNYGEAEAVLRDALARDNANPELMLLSARVKMAKGDVDPAIAELERTVSLYPQLPAASYLLGNAYAFKGNVEKAAEALVRTLRLVPGYVPAVVSLAELNVRRGSFGQAAASLKPVVEKYPDDTRAQLLYAEASRGTGDLGTALATYDRLEASTPGNAQFLYLKGIVLRQQANDAAARAAFERALVIQPAMIQPVQQLVALDLQAKAFNQARQRTELAIARSPKSADLYALLASVAIAQNNFSEAALALQRGIAVVPQAPTLYIMLARVYVTQHEQEKALAKLREATTQDPKNVEALLTTAVLYDVMGNREQAAKTYRTVLAMAPDSAVALNNLACILADSPGSLEAYDLAQRARTLLPDDPRTADTLGWILYLKGDYPAALALLRDSAPKLPDLPDAQYHLGMTCYMLGDESGARAALESAVGAKTPFDGLGTAKQKLALLATNASQVDSDGRKMLESAANQPMADPVALTRMSSLRQREGDLRKARSAAEAAVKASPKNAAALVQLARVVSAEGDRKLALDYAREAHILAPDDPGTTSLLGRFAYEDGQYRWAASLLEDAARAMPDDAEVQFDWAHAAYSIGRVTDAETASRRTIELEHTSSRAKQAAEFLALMSVAANPSKTSDTSIVESTLKRDPANLPALVAVAALAGARNGPKSAEIGYEQVLQRYPDFAPVQKALAILYAADRDAPATATRVAAKARESYPDDAAVAKAAGIIAYRNRDFTRAATLLQQSSAALSTDGEIQFYLGMSQYQLKRQSQANETLKRAVELGLPSDLEKAARRVLSPSS